MKTDQNQLAVLGSPISHSLSPKLHNLAYSKLEIKAKYESFEVKIGELAQFLESHSPEHWRGFSLTMPLKEEALEVVENLDAGAKFASAVNTLLSDGEKWQGLNTDIFGFRYLFETFDVFEDGRNSVSILGAGGTARAALVALDNFPGQIKVFRRNPKRDLLLNKANPRAAISNWEEIPRAFDSNVVINALPVAGIESIIGDAHLVNVVIDALYNPWPTLLSKIQVTNYVSGKDLLVAQALRQIELFSGQEIARGEVFTFLRSAI